MGSSRSGRHKTTGTIVTQMQFQPIVLKKLSIDCDITQGEIAGATGLSRPAINSCLNKGYIPSTIADFKARVEGLVRGNPQGEGWLAAHGLKLADIWQPAGEELKGAHPAGIVRRSQEAVKNSRPGMLPGNPDIIEFREVEMIRQEALKLFKLFRSPFHNDVQKSGDIFLDEDHRYIRAAMLDAAKHSGCLAIVGEVGSGKSTIRKSVIEEIRKEGDIQIVYPEILDKDRISSATLCDAIIMDISNERPKAKHEHKARQVRQLLLARSALNNRCVLIIEEAHRLNINAFRTLKQIYEMEDATGYKKLIGLILIGQTELGGVLDERYHPEIREFIRRCQVAWIQGLSDIRAYLDFKFKLVGGKLEHIIDDQAVKMLADRLTVKDERGKPISNAHPLTVNIYVIRAMNLAYELGFERVTAEVVEAI